MQAAGAPAEHDTDAVFDARQTMELFIEERDLGGSELARLLAEQFSARKQVRA